MFIFKWAYYCFLANQRWFSHHSVFWSVIIHSKLKEHCKQRHGNIIPCVTAMGFCVSLVLLLLSEAHTGVELWELIHFNGDKKTRVSHRIQDISPLSSEHQCPLKLYSQVQRQTTPQGNKKACHGKQQCGTNLHRKQSLGEFTIKKECEQWPKIKNLIKFSSATLAYKL